MLMLNAYCFVALFFSPQVSAFPSLNHGNVNPFDGLSKEPQISFGYTVKEINLKDESLVEHSRQEDGDTQRIIGEYRVLLPDGMQQVVRYTSGIGGYEANVSYEKTDNLPKKFPSWQQKEFLRKNDNHIVLFDPSKSIHGNTPQNFLPKEKELESLEDGQMWKDILENNVMRNQKIPSTRNDDKKGENWENGEAETIEDAVSLRPFRYKYTVDELSQKDLSQIRHSKTESSDGQEITGEYSTELEGGIKQIVRYTAGVRGFEAIVTYENVEQSNNNRNIEVKQPLEHLSSATPRSYGKEGFSTINLDERSSKKIQLKMKNNVFW